MASRLRLVVVAGKPCWQERQSTLLPVRESNVEGDRSPLAARSMAQPR